MSNGHMSAMSLTASLASLPRAEQIGLGALIGVVAAAPLSIAVAQILLTVAALAWFVSHLSRREPLEAPEFFWPLLAYAALTLVSAGFSQDPARSVEDCKQLVLYMLIPIVFDFARGSRARFVLTVILTAGAASALYGLVQYSILNFDNLGRRLVGTLSHWMTYSGTLMLVICVAMGRLLHDTRDRGWPIVVMPALVAALLLSFTRSAVAGAAAGVGALFLLRDLRLVAALPIIAAALIAVSPAQLTERIYSAFNLSDHTSRDRVAMLQAGVNIVKDYPLTGVGPDMVIRVYPDYRVTSAVQATNPHLHNVPMQIAAERGIPALLAWCWFVVTLSVGLFRLFRRTRFRVMPATALGAVAAMLTAGLFEYNFGDSEFLMLFLVIISLPFAADRDGGIPA